jgi:hypothetical protein
MGWSPCWRGWNRPISHLSQRGGLVIHSLHVYSAILDITKSTDVTFSGIQFPAETLAITALCHDFCKIHFYGTEPKWRKDANGRWEQYQAWVVKDQFPFGHGEKSANLAQRFIQLTMEESLAIRWHMGAFEPGVAFGYPTGFAFAEACRMTPLVRLLFAADQLATAVEDWQERDRKPSNEVR